MIGGHATNKFVMSSRLLEKEWPADCRWIVLTPGLAWCRFWICCWASTERHW